MAMAFYYAFKGGMKDADSRKKHHEVDVGRPISGRRYPAPYNLQKGGCI
jgi:hypothetical protein